MANKYEGYPEVRKVTVADREKLTELLKLFAQKSGNEQLRKMVPRAVKDAKSGSMQDEDLDKIYKAMQSVLESALKWLKDDVWDWFIDLLPSVNNIEEFRALEFDIEVYIIESLINQKGFKNFFISALKPFRWIQGFLDKLPN